LSTHVTHRRPRNQDKTATKTLTACNLPQDPRKTLIPSHQKGKQRRTYPLPPCFLPSSHGKPVQKNIFSTSTYSRHIDENTIIHSRTTIRGPVIIGDRCGIGPNAYIGPYTSIRDHTTIRNTEIENTIVMQGNHRDCGRRITDSPIEISVKALSPEQNTPKRHRSSWELCPQSPYKPRGRGGDQVEAE